MTENVIPPKWQRELRFFLGIKSGIILEGNVYDEFLKFQYEDDGIEFEETEDLDQTILSLVKEEQTDVFFFDPVEGFYCYESSPEKQKDKLQPLLVDYSTKEKTKDHGAYLCLMPSEKKGCRGSADTEQYIWVSEIIRRAISDKSKYTNKNNIVFVLNFASRLDACNLRAAESNTMFLNLMAATTSFQASQQYCNSLIMVVDKYNDIPAWVYLNNPNIRTISICVPDRDTRRVFLENLPEELKAFQILGTQDCEHGRQFIAETEGLLLQELKQILQLAYHEKIEPEKIDLAFKLYKYGVLDDPWVKLGKDKGILFEIEDKLRKRVKGQDEAINKVKTVVARAVKGLSGLQHSGASHKPRGILFFAGPTGVGKTETAKALAEAIFGDENACIRFDMSEYRLEQSDQKLFGAPPGYVGYEGGGQLTNAVKNRPFSVILFDEIEKASPTILDKFLQILEDGRMTDNQGNTVYFGETIIIFTSNIGLTKEEIDPANPLRSMSHRIPTITIEDPENPAMEDTLDHRNEVTKIITEGVKAYFNDNGRPELLNRLGEDNIVVFQFINVEDAKTICDYKLNKICDSIKEKKDIDIIIPDNIRGFLHEKAVLERAHGGRGVGNMLEREFINPFSSFICTLSDMPSKLQCYTGTNGIEFKAVPNDN
jgi:DNA polymerase III delta prime subunit